MVDPVFPITEKTAMKSVKANRGFTLVELMIVVAILSILTAIAIPAYRGYISSSRNTEGWNNLASVKLAQEEYFLENNRYFPDPDGLAETTDSSLDLYWRAAETNDSQRNFDYAVTSSATGTGYTATATGRGAGYDVPATETFSISK